jgi:hypothetical protein
MIVASIRVDTLLIGQVYHVKINQFVQGSNNPTNSVKWGFKKNTHTTHNTQIKHTHQCAFCFTEHLHTA